MNKSRLRTELCDYLIDCVNNGIDNDGKFTYAVLDAANVIKKVCNYVEKHGNISLSCGSEWMFQDDEGQVDALDLVGNILDSLEGYAEEDEDD